MRHIRRRMDPRFRGDDPKNFWTLVVALAAILLSTARDATMHSLRSRSMDDITLKPATAIAQALRQRKIGSRELLEHFVKRIERFNPKLNAVVTLDLDRARVAADAADQ